MVWQCINGVIPDSVQALAIVGAIVIWMLLAWIFGFIISAMLGKEYKWNEDGALCFVLGLVFPISLVILVIVAVINALIRMADCATRQDLRVVETRLTQKIETTCGKKCSNFREAVNPNKPFKVGDYITSKKGNPGNYKHLNDGCVCLVKSIDEKGSMQVILVDHKDKVNQINYLGQEFTAPARNFVKRR